MKQAFKPKPGQVDYTNIRYAPVINCVVRHAGKILLIRRSADLHFYPDYWNGVSGFLDDHKSIEEKVYEELREEVGMSRAHVLSLTRGEIFHQDEPKYKKTWIVHPMLVEVDTDRIKTDWEAQSFRWVLPHEVERLELLPGFRRVLKSLSLL